MGFKRKSRQASGADGVDLASSSGTSDLVFYLVSRFILVLVIVMLAETALVWFESLVMVPVLQRLVAVSSTVPNETTSLFSLVQGLLSLVVSLAQARYAQAASLASQSVVVLLAIVMLLALAVPPLLGALAFSRMVVRKVEALQARREKELAEIDRQRSQFMTDVAHDLRTPLMAISGMAHALEDGIVRDEAMRADYLRSICDKADAMGDLVSSVFDYTKLGGTSFSLDRHDLDLPQLLLREAALAYADAEDAGMLFSVHVPEDPCTIHADEVQFSRVVSNLLANAVRHNQPGTEIALMLARRAGVAYVVVADSGEPISGDPDDLFQPFTQGDTSRSKPGGSGLGLSICKRIADMHGYELGLAQPYGRFAKGFYLKCGVVD